ncbi:MAG: RNA polymerase subunit sigma-24, partial [Flavobacterium sp.]
NISEGTSKSQLNVSRSKLKELVNNIYYQNQISHGK